MTDAIEDSRNPIRFVIKKHPETGIESPQMVKNMLFNRHLEKLIQFKMQSDASTRPEIVFDEATQSWTLIPLTSDQALGIAKLIHAQNAAESMISATITCVGDILGGMSIENSIEGLWKMRAAMFGPRY
jgi:hypothetical protein